MEAFLSWSGNVSKEVALAMHDWLPDIIQPLKPWMSDKDLPKGTRWNEEIGKRLGTLSIGIFFLTVDNLNSGWIHFEAGAVAKTVEDSRVFTYLFGLDYGQVGYQPVELVPFLGSFKRSNPFCRLPDRICYGATPWLETTF